MKWLTTIAAVLLLFSAAPAQAQQDLPPPPPPPEIESEIETEVEAEVDPEAGTEVEAGAETGEEGDPEASQPAAETPADDAESADADAPIQAQMLSITSPIGGSEIGVATVVEGTASPRASVELYIDGTLEQRMKADKSGRFRATVSGLEPDTRTLIEVRELDADGEAISASSVMAKVVERQPAAVPEPAVVEGPEPSTEPEPARDPVIADDSIRSSSNAREIEAPVGQLTRGLISTGAGYLGGFAGSFVGILLGAAFAISFASGDGFEALAYIGLGAILGYTIAMPVAVCLTGYLLDGDGSIILTVLASYAGLALGIVGLGLISDQFETGGPASTALSFGVLLVGPAAGALVYELTSNPSRRAARAAEQGISMTPLVAPTADGRGAMIGLGGTW